MIFVVDFQFIVIQQKYVKIKLGKNSYSTAFDMLRLVLIMLNFRNLWAQPNCINHYIGLTTNMLTIIFDPIECMNDYIGSITNM